MPSVFLPAGYGSDFMYVGLQGGVVVVLVVTGNERLQVTTETTGGRYDDGQWHELVVERNTREVS